MERVEFYSAGERVVGDLYEAERSEPGPAVVLCHGFTGIKEMIMQTVGPMFAAAGITALAFDYRHFGESDGEPRSLLDPMAQVRDIRSALTFLTTRPVVDRKRMGLWGTSFGGGTAIYTAGTDERVRGVVAVMPVTDGRRWLRSLRGPEAWHQLLTKAEADRTKRALEGAGDEIWAFDVMPPDSITIPYVKEHWGNLKLPRNMMLESVELMCEFRPEDQVPNMAGRAPLLLFANVNDQIVPIEEPMAAYNLAAEPKRISHLLPDQHHWSAYFEPMIDPLMSESIEWFEMCLAPVAAR